MTDFSIFRYRSAIYTALNDNNSTPKSLHKYWEFPELSDIVQSLESFQHFETAIRATAIALRASELGVSQIHFYAIALHAGSGGVR